MGIKNRISPAPVNNIMNSVQESFYRGERDYRLDKLVEKWSDVPEIGKGITEMPADKARNLSVLLENEARVMSRMNEAQLSSTFSGYSPENMLKLIRLSYPNSIRGDLFTEFAMETANDSIKYVMPIYTKDSGIAGHLENTKMGSKFDGGQVPAWDENIMYESTESRYATEMVNVASTSIKDGSESACVIDFTSLEKGYVDGASEIYATDVDGRRVAVAVEVEGGRMAAGMDAINWLVNPELLTFKAETFQESAGQADGIYVKFTGVTPGSKAGEYKVAYDWFNSLDGEKMGGVVSTINRFVSAVGRYNSEADLTGEYLGEVELTVKDYHFRPRPVELGVTWTQLTELVLDTSYGVSAEEMLMDSAAQEIKKSLDFQAIKYADSIQRTNGIVEEHFDAEPVGGNIKDSYIHTAETVGNVIMRVGDNIYDKLNRGGVTAIVGGPSAVNYLALNKAWTYANNQSRIGGYKAGEFDGIPVYKVPSAIIANNELLTTWKNPDTESDVSIAIGTLLPFYSTGTIQRKNLYKEAAIARFEDTQALNPKYIGRIVIDNLRQ